MLNSRAPLLFKTEACVLFGGSFDPFHLGHKQIIQKILQEPKLRHLWVIPAFLNPFKSGTSFSVIQRLSWLRISLENIQDKRLHISTFELDRQESTPTFLTLTYLKNQHPQNDFWIVIGEDQLAKLQQWFNFVELKKQASFLIFGRKGYEKYSLDIFKEIAYLWVELDIPISANQIRSALKKGNYEILRWVDTRVAEEIQKAI